MNQNIRIILRFLLLLVLQLLFFEHMDLGMYVYPMPYILFLLLFPCTYSTAALMIWAFAFGLLLDFFSAGIMGLHTSAFVALAALRNGLIKAMTLKGDIDNLSVPGFMQFGTVRFVLFVLLCTAIHHTVYFFLEAFSLHLFWHTLGRLTGSLLLNTFLILLFKKTFYEQKR